MKKGSNAADIFSLIGAVFNCSAYQHPRRDRFTVAGEKK
jgi:hypothetical protein